MHGARPEGPAHDKMEPAILGRSLPRSWRRDASTWAAGGADPSTCTGPGPVPGTTLPAAQLAARRQHLGSWGRRPQHMHRAPAQLEPE